MPSLPLVRSLPRLINSAHRLVFRLVAYPICTAIRVSVFFCARCSRFLSPHKRARARALRHRVSTLSLNLLRPSAHSRSLPFRLECCSSWSLKDDLPSQLRRAAARRLPAGSPMTLSLSTMVVRRFSGARLSRRRPSGIPRRINSPGRHKEPRWGRRMTWALPGDTMKGTRKIKTGSPWSSPDVTSRCGKKLPTAVGKWLSMPARTNLLQRANVARYLNLSSARCPKSSSVTTYVFAYHREAK